MRVEAHINLAAFQHNFQRVKHYASRAKVMAMIKDNGYGHGLLLTAKALAGVDYFGVATLAEATAIRQTGIDKPLVLMAGIQHKDNIAHLQSLALDTIIYNERQLEILAAYRGSKKIRVWLKIDTGMHRLGCRPEQAEAFLRLLEAMPQVEIVAIMSHLACADVKDHSHTLRQLEQFETLTKSWAYPRSMLNSAGILFYPDFQYDIVRPGMMLYGASPTLALTPAEIGLKPTMDLVAPILALIQVKAGEGVGYGQTWQATRDSMIATVAAGYGDGYPQEPKNGMALVQGKSCPVVGRVSMDFLAVDVTDIPAVQEGEMVLLWGQELSVDDVALRMGTSVYRLLTGLMERVQRVTK